MHPFIYDVAVSLDGFICGPDEDVSKFAHDGEVVDDYTHRLSGYATAIMGKATYEFGYKFGLKPGQNPYPDMRTIVFSTTLQCPDDSQILIRNHLDKHTIADISASSNGPVYVCGGGCFAGALLHMKAIDRIILKRAPVVLGSGVSLFGQVSHASQLRRVSTKSYDNGYTLEEFTL